MQLPWWKAVLLGAVQGLTEFLPVSSSGHLAVLEHWLQVSVPFSFDIMVNLGTLVALLYYFRRQILHLSRKYLTQIVIATVPAAIVGFLLKPYFDQNRFSGAVLALMFLLSAFYMFIADRLLSQEDQTDQLGRIWQITSECLVNLADTFKLRYKLPAPNRLQALLIGLFQAIAILPGVSRSGSTLFAGLLVGLPRVAAFEFAFIMSVPAVLGAIGLDGMQLLTEGTWQSVPWMAVSIATVTAGIVGFLALRLLEYTIKHSRLEIFAWYLVLVSIVSFLFV